MRSACIVAVAPIRKEPSHRSEMTSQLLFNETVQVIGEEDQFTKIICDLDGYEGYVQSSQLLAVDSSFKADGYTIVHGEQVFFNGEALRLSLAAPLRSEQEWSIGKHLIRSELRPSSLAFNADNIRQFSSLYINTPYLWGGRSSFGIDCSGFCQQVFKVMGITLQRDAYQQAEQGELIGFLQEVTCGDLAFFDNAEGKITHVGIMLNDHEIIHASGRVRVDDIDQHGIINRDTGQRTHTLRIIRRMN